MNRITEAIAGFYAWLQDATGLSETTLNQLLATLAVIVVLGIARVLLIRVINHRTKDVRAQYQWRKTASYSIVALGVLLVGRIWVDEFGSVATFLGLVSAGLAIALRDLVTNVAGWGFIVWRRPFTPGDRIEILGRAGDVIDQRLFQFTLLEIGTPTGATQSTGRIIHIPNGRIFADPVTNYTRGFQYIWNEISIVVTFESNWRAAKEILLRIAQEKAEELSEDAERKVREAAQEYMIFYSKLTPTVYTSVAEYGVRLTVRYLVEPRRQRGSEETLWELVLDAFGRRDDIAIAFPAQRFYHNVAEGARPGRPFRAPDDEPPGGPPDGDRGRAEGI